jgi:hypothetical protein
MASRTDPLGGPTRGRFALEVGRSLSHFVRASPETCPIQRLPIAPPEQQNGGLRQDLVVALMAWNADTLGGILGNFVPYCPYRHAKQLCRSRSVPMGMRERFQNQVPLDVSQGRPNQPSSETAARRRGNRGVRLHVSQCADSSPKGPSCPAPEHNKKVNDFLTRPQLKAENRDALPGGLHAVDPISKSRLLEQGATPGRKAAYRKFCRRWLRPRPRFMSAGGRGGCDA